MIDDNSSVKVASAASPGAEDDSTRPSFQYRSVKHRRKSDGLFQFTPSLGGVSSEKKSAERKKRANNNQSIEAIEKSTKARILNTIADAIHQRRSLFGSTISNVRKAFAAFDRDGDGFISQNEFRSAVRRLGLGLSEIQTTACFDVLRSTGSTSGIDYHDFTQALQNRRDSMIT